MVSNVSNSPSEGARKETRAAGERVGGARYILKRKLGRGACTEVWLGRDSRLEQEVALKFLPLALAQDPGTIEALDRETRRSAQLAHPAIARVYEFVTDYHVAAFATEYVEGWDLDALKVDRPEKRYQIEEIAPWIRQLCEALEYAHHEFCLVHRALKPSNLLLNARGQVKVADFAIDEALHRVALEQRFLADLPIGHRSPQQVQGAEPSVLDDIYALGATIYDLVTGTPPFYKGDTRAQIQQLAAPTMSQRLAELGIHETIPPQWEETVASCLAKEPGRRPHSAHDVLRNLETTREPQPAPASKTTRGLARNGSTKIPLPLQKPLERAVAMAGRGAKRALDALRKTQD